MARATLMQTDMPGVYKNRKGYYCNEHGVALDFIALKAADNDRWRQATGADEPPQTPADLLRAASQDPRLPLADRLRAAREAAPYFNQKKPLAVEAVGDFNTKSTIDIQKLAGLSSAERKALLELLRKVGVEV
jgi:hypothetical protein